MENYRLSKKKRDDRVTRGSQGGTGEVFNEMRFLRMVYPQVL